MTKMKKRIVTGLEIRMAMKEELQEKSQIPARREKLLWEEYPSHGGWGDNR